MAEHNRAGRTGPPKKDRTAKQVTVTIAPDLYDSLVEFMDNNGLSNRSGTIANFIKVGLEECHSVNLSGT